MQQYQCCTPQEDEESLLVDERNTNAVALYETLGYAFVLPPSPPSDNAVIEFFRKATADPVAMRKILAPRYPAA